MDLLCDALLVEEILPHLPLKYVLRFGATARRYNAIVHSAEFRARYWRQTRSGVFLRLFGRRIDKPVRVPRFLTGASASASESVSGADLAFMPGATARETAYLRHLGSAPAGLVVVHSSAGLLLCSRGRIHPVHYYVCNPVTWQWVALPELPCPSSQLLSGVLTVDADGDGTAATPTRFQVVLFNQPDAWLKGYGRLDLRVFSSDTGRREVRQLEPTLDDEDIFPQPILLQTGHAFWIPFSSSQAVAYDGAKPDNTVYLLKLPPQAFSWNRCLGRRQDGTLQCAHSYSSDLPSVGDQLQDGEGVWELVHQISDTELLRRRNPEVEALVHSRTRSQSELSNRGMLVVPLGFHPTQHDVVFLAVPGAVAAYSIERGTVSLQYTVELDDCYVKAHDLFQYTHPPYPVLIPAIKSSDITPESLRLPTPEALLLSEMLPCSCVLVPRNQ